jgi:hypothetical protein
MFVPPGYTEEEVLEISERILSYLAPMFTFGYYDIKDIKQEGFLLIMDALPRYNGTTVLETFLVKHLRNRLSNLLRDKFHRKIPPCSSCKDKSICCLDKMEHCKKLESWNSRNAFKKNMMKISENGECQALQEVDLFGNLYKKEIILYLSDNLPMSYRSDFCRFLDGGELDSFRSTRLINMCRKIIEESPYDE